MHKIFKTQENRFFTVRVLKHWHRLLREVMGRPSEERLRTNAWSPEHPTAADLEQSGWTDGHLQLKKFLGERKKISQDWGACSQMLTALIKNGDSTIFALRSY